MYDDRRLPSFERVGREFVQERPAGLPGRLAGLLSARYLARALPRCSLFQHPVFCMIDHGLLLPDEPIIHGPRSCLALKVERRLVGTAT